MPNKDPEAARRAVRKYREKIKGTQKYKEMRQADWAKLQADPEKKAKRNAKKRKSHADAMSSDPEYREKIKQRSATGNSRLRDLPEEERIARTRKYRLKSAWGMTPEDFDRMMEAQGGCCAICKTTDPGSNRRFFAIDHDHKTGKLRALLCNMCNLGLGKFQDDIERLRAAILYLETHQEG